MMAVTREIAEREARAMDNAGTDAMVDELIGAAVKERYPAPVQDVAEVLIDRAAVHGDFNDHAEYTQRIKQVLHSAPNWLKLTVTQKEGLEMLAHKVGRILAGDPNHPDHWLDIEGYARITRERL